MSKKAFFRRVATTAVTALGFSALAIISSPVASAAANSFSLSTVNSSLTVVGSGTSGRSLGAIRVTVLDEAGDAANLAAGESLTISLVSSGLPAATTGFTPATTDYTFEEVTNRVLLSPDTGQVIETTKRTDGVANDKTGNCVDSTDTDMTVGDYCFAIKYNASNVAMDKGQYTFQIRLSDGSVTYQSSTVKFKWVSDSADSGAVITVATAGALVVGSTFINSAANYASDYAKATLRDADGGRIVTTDTTSISSVEPNLVVTSEETDAAGTTSTIHTSSATAGWSSSDTGTAFDHGSATTNYANDGVYGLNLAQAVVAHDATLTPATIRVRYGLANATATIAVRSAATANAASSTITVTGDGLYNSTAADTVTAFNAETALTWNAPLTTTSVTIKVRAKDQTTAQQNTPLTFTVTWSGNATGAVTPVSGVTGRQTVTTNSSGDASITITQTSPLQGSQAIVAVSGFSEGTFGNQTIIWKAPELTTLTPEVTAFKAEIGASNSVRILARDQFANPMSGVIMQPSFTSTSATYGSAATNAARATIASGSDGYATFTWTGAATAEADDVDAVSFTSTYGGVSSKSSGTITVTYGTVPVVATLTGYYNTDQSTAAGGTWTDLFSTTPIGAVDPLDLQTTLNYSLPVVVSGTSATDSQVKLRVRALTSAGAAATGVPVTVTASAGGHFTDSCTGAAGRVVTTKTCYPNTTGYIYINTIGTGTSATYTFTSGAVSASQTIYYETASGNARFVTLTGDASAVVATVTDRFGNPVSGIAVQISTSAGTLGGGQKTASYNTVTDGTVTVSVEADGAATVTAYATTANDHTSLAGYVGAVSVDSSLAAGVRTATLGVTGTGNAAKNAAEAASDAALEAIDAANAATDAANLAAEAADAATVAAEEARDAADSATAAVEALASEVATLMAALKAQITTLAKTVAKIAKKVKA